MITPIKTMRISDVVKRQEDLLVSQEDIHAIAENKLKHVFCVIKARQAELKEELKSVTDDNTERFIIKERYIELGKLLDDLGYKE